MAKAVRYPHSETTDLLDHENLRSPSTTMHSRTGGGSYSTGTTPAYKPAVPHRFDTKVLEIMHREKMEAMVRARHEFPSEFQSYQRSHSGGTFGEAAFGKLGLPKTPPIYPRSDDQDQQTSRGRVKGYSRRVRHHDQQVDAAAKFLQAEIRKGFSPIVAQQRTMQLFGYAALPLVRDDANIQKRFRDAADDLLDASDAMPRTSASRKLRLARPDWYYKLRNSA